MVDEDEEGNAMMEPSVVREASVEPLAFLHRKDFFKKKLPLGVKMTGARKLHKEGLTGKGVRVAVIDSGVDIEHPGFNGQVKQQVWFRHGTPLCESDHGTHVAGTIHMMAPEAEIYDYRVFGPEGVKVDKAIARAIKEAVNDGCDIINMSLGGATASFKIGLAIKYAHLKGVHMIVAAGNAGDDDPTTNEYRYVPRTMYIFLFNSILVEVNSEISAY